MTPIEYLANEPDNTAVTSHSGKTGVSETDTQMDLDGWVRAWNF